MSLRICFDDPSVQRRLTFDEKDVYGFKFDESIVWEFIYFDGLIAPYPEKIFFSCVLGS